MKKNNKSDQPIFYVGLCMAGAISAGAYTAGVMDFLFEALEEWEKHRGEDGVPSHRIIIPIIGGASAGGMTSIITAAGIGNSIKPVSMLPPNNLSQLQPDNIFYHSWVDMTQTDMFPMMLETSDIEEGKVYSALNSNFIDKIAERAIDVANVQTANRPYLEPNLKIFATLTNLKGFSFDIAFNATYANAAKYHVQRHNDYACFQLVQEKEVPDSGWIPLNFANRTNTILAKNAAMATGAFPIGLRARKVSRQTSDVNSNEWLKDITSVSPVQGMTYDTLNVDGGLINNEPFEKVREVLLGLTKQNMMEAQNYHSFESTIIMIDPFPSTVPDFVFDETLPSVLASTFGAMMGQLRTKPATLASAWDSNLSGQFLIAPTRNVPQFNRTNIKEQGAKAIASGTLGGFGGFLHKEFRIHDYFLGRANCEQFLREYLTVPKATKNNIFKNGFKSVGSKGFRNSVGDYQIIPIFKTKESNLPMPIFSGGNNWPVRKEKDITEFEDAIKNRVQAVAMNITDYSWTTKIKVWLGAKIFSGQVRDKIMDAIKGSLSDHQLLRLE
jgi:hypothetical protein